jgi:DnaD/phage-associated family protein
MAKINLYNEQTATATYVPNIFIDEYMTQANGEYVKIYLYLLRCINQVGHSFSLSQIADHFDCTERDILRALKYWEKLHLFRLEYDENQNLSGICFLTDALSSAPAKEETQKSNVTNRFIQTSSPSLRSYTMDEMKAFCEKENVRELVFITEQYLGRTLNQSDLNIIFFWYDELHFSTDLIEFLIENCVAKGHTSLHYMQRIAEDFSARQIHTVEEARNMMNQDTADYHAVMKAFGIRGRNLVPSETSFIRNWSTKMGFSTELIAEACSRTIRAIHEPSFGYANSILEKWHKNNIHTMEDVTKSDEAFLQAQKTKTAKPAGPANSNRFINFKQRDNDYEELQRQLLQNSYQ